MVSDAPKYPLMRMIGSDPGPGQCKLRIKSTGDPHTTTVHVVDHEGVERELLGVEAVSFTWAGMPELPRVTLRVHEAEVDLQGELVDIDVTREPLVCPHGFVRRMLCPQCRCP